MFFLFRIFLLIELLIIGRVSDSAAVRLCMYDQYINHRSNIVAIIILSEIKKKSMQQ